jgi:pyrimidine operon attenuation protein/uracil phosphoribosyltransferase
MPIQPDYRDRCINNEKVKVEWSENNGEDVVYLVTTERT